MCEKVTLADKVALLDDVYSPGIVGYLNDYKLAVVKVRGEFVWHKHDDTDDFFLVLSGRMTIQLRDRDISSGQVRCLSSLGVSSRHRPRPTWRRTSS